jgi:hypothetical protein
VDPPPIALLNLWSAACGRATQRARDGHANVEPRLRAQAFGRFLRLLIAGAVMRWRWTRWTWWTRYLGARERAPASAPTTTMMLMIRRLLNARSACPAAATPMVSTRVIHGLAVAAVDAGGLLRHGRQSLLLPAKGATSSRDARASAPGHQTIIEAPAGSAFPQGPQPLIASFARFTTRGRCSLRFFPGSSLERLSCTLYILPVAPALQSLFTEEASLTSYLR